MQYLMYADPFPEEQQVHGSGPVQSHPMKDSVINDY